MIDIKFKEGNTTFIMKGLNLDQLKELNAILAKKGHITLKDCEIIMKGE